METEARYTLMGLFTLAVLAAGFAFVYWLNTIGGLSQRSIYNIRYENTVSGLTRGSAVLFNGLRVGEVTALAVSPENPRFVTATIAVDETTPIRSDTRVAMDFQGLMGAPAVALFGGSGTATAVTGEKGGLPLLVADPLAGQNMTQTARDALRHVDALVTENSEPLRNLIANINTFSNTLARNADRVDGIVAGLERMTGGGAKPQQRIFDLPPAQDFAAPSKLPTGQLIIPEPTSLALLDTDKILLRYPDGDRPGFAGAQWPDMLPKVVQSRVIQSFENAGYLRAIGRQPEGMTGDYTLLLDLRSFYVLVEPTPTAVVEIASKIVTPDGKMIDAQIFKSTVPLAQTSATLSEPTKPEEAQQGGTSPTPPINASSAVAALQSAFARAATDIVLWVCKTI